MARPFLSLMMRFFGAQSILGGVPVANVSNWQANIKVINNQVDLQKPFPHFKINT